MTLHSEVKLLNMHRINYIANADPNLIIMCISATSWLSSQSNYNIEHRTTSFEYIWIQTWTAKAGTYSKNSTFMFHQLTTSKLIMEEHEETIVTWTDLSDKNNTQSNLENSKKLVIEVCFPRYLLMKLTFFARKTVLTITYVSFWGSNLVVISGPQLPNCRRGRTANPGKDAFSLCMMRVSFKNRKNQNQIPK